MSDFEMSPTGEYLAIGSLDGSVRIVDRSGRSVGLLREENGFVGGLARFSPDGRLIATASHHGADIEANYRVRVWDWERGEPITAIRTATEQVEFDPSGTLIATAWDRQPEIWDVRSGALVTTLPAQPGDIFAIEFSPDGSRLATGSADGTVRLFDSESGRQLLVLRGHLGIVAGFAFSPDGSMLAATTRRGSGPSISTICSRSPGRTSRGR